MTSFPLYDDLIKKATSVDLKAFERNELINTIEKCPSSHEVIYVLIRLYNMQSKKKDTGLPYESTYTKEEFIDFESKNFPNKLKRMLYIFIKTHLQKEDDIGICTKPPGKKSRTTFTLTGINLGLIAEKYSYLGFETSNENKPVTKVNELLKPIESLSFYNESKNNIICTVLMIDFTSKKKIDGYRCWYDHHKLSDNTHPIGCPIEFVFDKTVKSYVSEISKNSYSIIEDITENKTTDLPLDKRSYYITDGIFCSFNCTQAYLNKHKKEPLFKNSQQLLFRLYQDIFHKETSSIVPSPDFKLLIKYGGNLTIEQYRNSFNKVEYIDRDIIKMYPQTNIYEEKILL